jgi:hypothetical protein
VTKQCLSISLPPPLPALRDERFQGSSTAVNISIIRFLESAINQTSISNDLIFRLRQREILKREATTHGVNGET